ncbi:uncharacterized protein Z519_08141 [Cladophialophora bantiana CBS 173.52]|uniref:Major facilitator superfamily (MFS) profile domain-containing protein n=1 Tax=Cladophialophora bantiana (strain ATCC 10958 / CBS 173.52 / CDC B-1940 / NIH 8579) TaxID=1442370 RepID=A0A0D2HKE6_CLAB1|nr:uncharacterized protein Z519_08141 [Cladophialophora bantiana CBS 173.52]KIW91245.1 hypothetical protein Z519_08141 [Cladophialophora bantiana CBS 173.52]
METLDAQQRTKPMVKDEFENVATEIRQESNDVRVSERHILLKCDLNLLPMLCLLFMCTILDRVNIANARIQGLEKDLHMHGQDFSVVLFVFFILYILLEIPANILIKKIRPSVFLSLSVFTFGVVTMCQGLTRSYAGLVVCRVILGGLEAGVYPGSIYLMTMFYKRHEFQWRLNIFYGSSLVTGAFSGLLAYAIAHMDGIAGYGGWRWILITEGLITIAVAIPAYWLLPDWPETAKFLNEDERQFWAQRLASDVKSIEMNILDRQAIKRCFGDVKIWIASFAYFCILTTSYGFAYFLPTILLELGWTSTKAQVMTIPLYAVGTVVCLSCAFVSDYLKHRFLFIVGGCVLAIIAYAILLSYFSVSVGVRYFALYILECGIVVAQPGIVGWLSNNLGGHYKRGVGIAMQLAIGNIGGIVGSNIYLQSEAPTYPTGFGTGVRLLSAGALASCVLLWYLRRENKLRDKGARDYRYNLSETELNNLGDDHPAFRFSY